MIFRSSKKRCGKKNCSDIGRTRRDGFEDSNWNISTRSDPDNWLQRPRFAGIEVTVEKQKPASGVLVEDVESIAIETFKAERPIILLRTLGRTLLKYLGTRKVREKNETLGLLTNLVGVLTEQADTRSWQTLPNQIFMVRMPLPEGTHTLKYSFLDANGQVRRSVTGQIWKLLRTRYFF